MAMFCMPFLVVALYLAPTASAKKGSLEMNITYHIIVIQVYLFITESVDELDHYVSLQTPGLDCICLTMTHVLLDILAVLQTPGY